MVSFRGGKKERKHSRIFSEGLDSDDSHLPGTSSPTLGKPHLLLLDTLSPTLDTLELGISTRK